MKKALIALLLLLSHYSISQTIIYEDKLNWIGDDQRVAGYVDNNLSEDITIYVIDGPVYRQHFGFVEILPKNTYIIVLANNLTVLEYLETYVHEIVHVQQFHRGDAVRVGGRIIWKGKKYSPFISYSKRPWEIEATYISKKYIN